MGCHFLLQGIFPTQGQNARLLAWQADSLATEPPGKPLSEEAFSGTPGWSEIQTSIVVSVVVQLLTCV